MVDAAIVRLAKYMTLMQDIIGFLRDPMDHEMVHCFRIRVETCNSLIVSLQSIQGVARRFEGRF